MFVKALLLNIYFYNMNMNLSKYKMAGNSFNFKYFSFKSKKTQHICFHDNHESNDRVGVVLIADSRSILIYRIVYLKCIHVEVGI